MNKLEDLVTEIHTSAKYRHVAPDFIRSIGAQELDKRRDYKDAVKSTKNKLHQVGGAYLDHTPLYDSWLSDMRTAYESGGLRELRPFCERLMSLHASTRERLPILEEFYETVFDALPPIHSVLDLACGFNPLAIPWMKLTPGAAYYAVDIYGDMMRFLQDFITLCGNAGHTQTRSVANRADIEHKVDLAFVLKAIPCLEQVDKLAGARLLETLNADYVLISFPIHSLGGRSKGMPATYENHFKGLLAGKPWTYQRFEFATELAFLVTRIV